MSSTGATRPASRAAPPTATALLPYCGRRCAIHVAASPPSTANGGNTNTKWRMPLYMAGRVAMVIRIGSDAASGIGGAALAGAHHGRDRAGRAAEPEEEHQFRQLHGKKRRNVTSRHVDNWNELPVKQLAPGLFEKIREIL